MTCPGMHSKVDGRAGVRTQLSHLFIISGSKSQRSNLAHVGTKGSDTMPGLHLFSTLETWLQIVSQALGVEEVWLHTTRRGHRHQNTESRRSHPLDSLCTLQFHLEALCTKAYYRQTDQDLRRPDWFMPVPSQHFSGQIRGGNSRNPILHYCL